MDLKETFYKYKQKLTDTWSTGKIQRSSRITYDVFWNVILLFAVVGFIGLFFAGGIGAGYFASLVQDESVRSYEEMEQDIYDYTETTQLYFANEAYLGDIRAEIHRDETTLENVSETLINAVIATEDEYFEVHQGVVPKAIIRAALQDALNADMQTGGSTLTQQLIKNQMLTNEVSFERKAKEILLALRVERFFEKDEILQAYLNIVPYGRDSSGRNIAGVQTAAQGVFGVDADEVNLTQAAYLAGLPQSPTSYTPFTNHGEQKDEEGLQAGLNRMNTVLHRMYLADFITEEEYEEALEYDLVADFAESSPLSTQEYPSLTFELQERAQDIIMKLLAEDDGYTMEDLDENEDLKEEYEILAERDLRHKGYEIHSTIDKEIHDGMQEVTQNFDNFGPDTVTNIQVVGEDGEEETAEIEQQVQAGGILIENSSGKIISFVGNRDYSEESQLNYATNAKRSIGSTIKPLLVYAPAMDKGAVQPGTPVADVELDIQFPGQEFSPPSNYSDSHYGLVSTRDALSNSYNVSTTRVYSQIIEDDPGDYIRDMGITSITDEEFHYPSLSIGGTTTGVTLEENTNAFSTFGNDGNFADAYMIEEIRTADGESLYEHESETRDVFSPQTNYLTIDILRDVLTEGTGTYVDSQLAYSGVDWAGKTGTSQNWEDVLFMGTNPNVTFGTWMGYDTPDQLYRESDPQGHSQSVQKFWAELVNSATDTDPELMAPENNFERPDGIVERSYCAISGMLPSDLCEEAGLVQTDLFNSEFVPTETDDSLIQGDSSVTVNGNSIQAGSNTPSEFAEGDGLSFNPEFLERNGYDELNSITELFPRTNRDSWENIGIPNGGMNDAIEDDGNDPEAPTSLSTSDSNITWNESSSNDVVGYRIFSASNSGDDFSLMGNTTGTSYSIGDDNAVYHVRAVDYFGRESSPSSEIMVGDTSDSEDETADEDQDDENSDDDNDDDD
ncbi:penicillin-binding protein [Virgibacillus natechei]|uniref:Penicillin-binding protein n=1 Tax=Virgibacillus natechei TaxID=1216297 RepID=A0ABS4IE59_9BACI|nr:transglycosylase domain-containing protein [Virgibacillus natechei]MBP1968915.1 penicillin-binding protein [Virgibacillus natechei]UZD11707.1 penicillin-binding protein [Virgibacillus natechei]